MSPQNCKDIYPGTYIGTYTKDTFCVDLPTHSSSLAWKIPWTEKPCRLQSMGSQRVGHNWATSHTTKITADGDFSYEIKRSLLLGKSYGHPRQHTKKQRCYFANKVPPSQSCGFSSSHVWMWELDYKESWALKNWCLWSVVLENTLESPLDSKKIQAVHPKGKQSWIFIGRYWSWSW